MVLTILHSARERKSRIQNGSQMRVLVSTHQQGELYRQDIKL